MSSHSNVRCNIDAFDDTLVAHAIVTGRLPRETLPAELLEALQPILAFYSTEQDD
ncbi:MAG: hypothetical protein OHK0050_38900 [Roseiflexaceae bacterium]